MMGQFKVGDRVRVVSPVEGWACRPESFDGCVGVISACDEDGKSGDIYLSNGETWAFFFSELKHESVAAPETITLRDQFAMAALVGLLASGAKDSGRVDPHVTIAIAAYATSDAMLAERERAK